MSRRTASNLLIALVATASTLGASGCGGPEREAATPPPIAASKPAPQPEPASAPAPAPTTAAAPPQAAPPAAAGAADNAAAAASPKPAVEPPYTPGTALPGSIPPSPAPEADAKPAEQPADPLKWLQDTQARKSDYAKRVSAAEGNVEATRLKAVEWDKVVLAFKNPFLPRPVLSPEDQQAIQGLGGAERVRWAEGRQAEARAASDAAQKALADLKANPPLN